MNALNWLVLLAAVAVFIVGVAGILRLIDWCLAHAREGRRASTSSRSAKGNPFARPGRRFLSAALRPFSPLDSTIGAGAAASRGLTDAGTDDPRREWLIAHTREHGDAA